MTPPPVEANAERGVRSAEEGTVNKEQPYSASRILNSALTGSPRNDTAITPLLWTIRFASALGLSALSLTGEITSRYWGACWAVWIASFWLDRHPAWQARLRSWETAAVVALISVFLLDFFVRGYSIFLSIAHFLLLFQVFKLLGAKTRKDCLQILIFSFFQILSACTLSVDAWHALILLLLIPTATAGLFWQQVGRDLDASGQPLPASDRKAYRRLAVGMCLAAIPMNALLAGGMFMVFPRLAFRGAFAGLGSGRSGYNEQLNLAQTGWVGTDNSAVLWLKISPEGERAQWNGYLRGATLDYFDGKKWSHRNPPIFQALASDTNGVFKILPRARTAGRGLRQTITLVNTAGNTLFGAPAVGEIVAPLTSLLYYSDGSVHWGSGWRKPLQYDVLSYEMPQRDSLGVAALSPRGPRGPDYLQLPALPLKPTRALANRIALGRTPDAQARAIENYLRSHYAYSLNQGNQIIDNPLEDFLFVRRQGPCGHFATAMTIMLRLKGIPARLVAGYRRGSWNNRAGQYLIRERDAHAWVEAYFKNVGWVRFDPTPRVDAVSGLMRWQLRLEEYWDYLNYQWDRLVIEYDLYSQLKVVNDIQSNTGRINAWIAGWLGYRFWPLHPRRGTATVETTPASGDRRANEWWIKTLLSALLAGLAWGLWRFRKRTPPADPAIRFYQKFLARMARAGYPKEPSETGWEFMVRLQQTPLYREPAARLPLLELTQRYYHARFAPTHRR